MSGGDYRVDDLELWGCTVAERALADLRRRCGGREPEPWMRDGFLPQMESEIRRARRAFWEITARLILQKKGLLP